MAFLATTSVAQKAEVYATDKGAIQGYDPVAYFTEGKPVEGKSDISFLWKGQTWHFSNQTNLEKFKSDPEKYAPQFGGYCAFGMSRGYKAQTDPAAFTIVNDRLYLNYNLDVRTEWSKKREELIQKAEKNWPEVKSKD